MFLNLRFSPPCPDGMVEFEDRVEVAGIDHEAANAFASGAGHRLEFVPEPTNPSDANAIKVVGVTRGWLFKRRRFLGYVPRLFAGELARRGLTAKARPRLFHIWAASNGYAVLRFDILVPEGS